MSITFYCSCGQPLVVDAVHARSAANCPVCGGTCVVPAAGEASTPANAQHWKKAEEAIPVVKRDPNSQFQFGVEAGDFARGYNEYIQEEHNVDATYAGPHNSNREVPNIWVACGLTAMFLGGQWLLFAFLDNWTISYPLILLLFGCIPVIGWFRRSRL